MICLSTLLLRKKQKTCNPPCGYFWMIALPNLYHFLSFLIIQKQYKAALGSILKRRHHFLNSKFPTSFIDDPFLKGRDGFVKCCIFLKQYSCFHFRSAMPTFEAAMLGEWIKRTISWTVCTVSTRPSGKTCQINALFLS